MHSMNYSLLHLLYLYQYYQQIKFSYSQQVLYFIFIYQFLPVRHNESLICTPKILIAGIKARERASFSVK